VRLYALVEGHVLAFGQRLSLIRVFYTEHAALTGERRAEIMRMRRHYSGYVDELLREGQADGAFCAELDPAILTNAILTMMNSVYVWYRPGHHEPMETVATTFAHYTLMGLRCPPDHDHRPVRRRRAAASVPSRSGPADRV
jgi:hypothetical protein